MDLFFVILMVMFWALVLLTTLAVNIVVNDEEGE